jgi:hypothetical protein
LQYCPFKQALNIMQFLWACPFKAKSIHSTIVRIELWLICRNRCAKKPTLWNLDPGIQLLQGGCSPISVGGWTGVQDVPGVNRPAARPSSSAKWRRHYTHVREQGTWWNGEIAA